MTEDSSFGPRLRTVLAAANDEAGRLRHHYTGTEHLLLGLLDEGKGVGVTVLRNLGVDLESLRTRAQSFVEPGPPENANLVARPFTARARRALALAGSAARGFGHHYVETEHLVLGLVEEKGGVAGHALLAAGVDADAVRAEIARVLEVPLPPAE